MSLQVINKIWSFRSSRLTLRFFIPLTVAMTLYTDGQDEFLDTSKIRQREKLVARIGIHL